MVHPRGGVATGVIASYSNNQSEIVESGEKGVEETTSPEKVEERESDDANQTEKALACDAVPEDVTTKKENKVESEEENDPDEYISKKRNRDRFDEEAAAAGATDPEPTIKNKKTKRKGGTRK
jgi:hypothetical protein